MSLVPIYFLVFGYLCGSIPFGLLLTRAAGLGDVRNIGSGNIGATNVLRTGNKGLAAATLLLDALKGAVPAIIALRYGPEPGGVAGLGAVYGHIYPVWLGFKGGKGVATYVGVLAGLAWPVALIFAAVWLAVAVVTRYASLASLVAAVAAPIAAFASRLAPVRRIFPRDERARLLQAPRQHFAARRRHRGAHRSQGVNKPLDHHLQSFAVIRYRIQDSMVSMR